MGSDSLASSDISEIPGGTVHPAATGFNVWNAADPAQAARWLRLWETLPSQDIHSHPHYVRLFCGPADRAVSAWESPQGKILFPFILRDLTAEPYCPADLRPASDLTTPYGYGGSACWDCPAPDGLADLFWPAFDAWAGAQGLVSQFVRFSLFDDETLPYCGSVAENRKVVLCDLRPPEAEIVRQFSRNTRYNLRKTGRFNLRVECDEQGLRLAEFLGIYEHTIAPQTGRGLVLLPGRVLPAASRRAGRAFRLLPCMVRRPRRFHRVALALGPGRLLLPGRNAPRSLQFGRQLPVEAGGHSLGGLTRQALVRTGRRVSPRRRHLRVQARFCPPRHRVVPRGNPSAQRGGLPPAGRVAEAAVRATRPSLAAAKRLLPAVSP